VSQFRKYLGKHLFRELDDAVPKELCTEVSEKEGKGRIKV
jgi:hypothetical protein